MQCKMTYKCEHFIPPAPYKSDRLFIRDNPHVPLDTLMKICVPNGKSTGSIKKYLQIRLDKYLKENPDAIPPGYPEEV